MAKRRRRKGLSPTAKIFLRVFFITILLCILIATFIVLGALFGLIDPASDLDIDELKLTYTSKIYYLDSNGQPIELETIYGEEDRVEVTFANIPLYLRDAIVAIEDERFYKHRGVDIKSTSKAVFDYVLKRPGRGASTITQQLVKNISGDDERAVDRKAREIFRAISLERKMSKDEILELYLNTIYLGEGCSGVGSASQLYFNKPVSDLNLAECALIAGITQYPTKYDPILNFEASKEKQETVLAKMLQLKKITQEEHDEAVAFELQIDPEDRASRASVQSYFGDLVIKDVLNDLITTKGYSESDALKLIYTGGLKIYATVDPAVQDTMQEVYDNPKNFPNSDELQSAMVVLDAKTGAIKGVIGGRGEKTGSRTLNRATDSLRQPGSAMKPIGVYAPALEYNLIAPSTVIADEPITIGGWTPKNYYGGFWGPITIRYAVTMSVNTVAVRVLEKVGLDTSFDFLKNNLGVTSLVDSRIINGTNYSDKTYPSLSLGGLTDGISPLEISAAYETFANQGIYTKPYSYTKVLDNKNRVVIDNKPKTSVAMNKTTATLMTSMLKSVVTSGTGTGANFRSDIDICGKTGTTDADKDRWFVGYTPYYVGAVWCGFDQPKSMSSIVSANPSVPIWRKVMEQIHKDKSAAKFDQPEGTIMGEYCTISGMKPSDFCSQVGTIGYDYFPPGTEPTDICDSHIMLAVDTTTNRLATQYCPNGTVAYIVVERNDSGIYEYDGSIISSDFCTLHDHYLPDEDSETPYYPPYTGPDPNIPPAIIDPDWRQN